jgi:uncharacterized protein YbaR (Trm112 family)
VEVEMVKKELLEILVCPKCKGELQYDKEQDKLTCNICRLIYAVKDDIPIMLIDEAEKF